MNEFIIKIMFGIRKDVGWQKVKWTGIAQIIDVMLSFAASFKVICKREIIKIAADCPAR
jgi:hypothetical protein